MPDDQKSRPRVTIKQLHDQLHAAIEAIETGEQWQSWLDFAGRFHSYSFDNLLLIMAQRPNATAVASYTTWKTVNRQVQRGERSIKIFAPITRRTDVTDPQGNPVRDADGRQQTRRTVTGFRPVSVFDISQTSGPPVPEPARPQLLAGQAPTGLWDALASEVAERGYRLLRPGSEQLGTANGLTLPGQREVWVRDDVDSAQAVKTLAHELAHIMLHTDDEDAPCRGVREVEAESVAYLTLAAHGLASGTYTFPYVTSWAYSIAAVEHVPLADIVTRTGQRVMKTARTIIDGIKLPESTLSATTTALAARTRNASERTPDLREESNVRALPPIERAALLGVVADSAAYFRSHLRGSWVPGYLDDRNLGAAIATHEIGYAPEGWTSLTDHLRLLGYTDEHIQASGMATKARTGRLVDRFRDRMTLPLRDSHGDLVGFTARVNPRADGDAGPKYLNSPATSIFQKRELLYGLPEHRGALEAGHLAVICEGPLDAIAVDLAALRTGRDVAGIATSGTALTDGHVQLVIRAAPNPPICLAFDADDAGRAAAERAWEHFVGANTNTVTIAELPEGADPASFGNDLAALSEHLSQARPAAYVLADRKIDTARADGNPPRQSILFQDLIDWAEHLPADQRVDLAVHVAKRLDIDAVEASETIARRHPGFMADATLDGLRRHSAAINNKLQLAVEVDHEDARSVGVVTNRSIATR